MIMTTRERIHDEAWVGREMSSLQRRMYSQCFGKSPCFREKMYAVNVFLVNVLAREKNVQLMSL